jgi:hypothetical protein
VIPSSVSLQFLAPLSPFLLLLVIVSAVFAIRLYRRTRPPLHPGMAALLLGLRLASLLLLALLLLEPVLSLFREREAPPRLVLLLDDSLSMSIPFRGRGGRLGRRGRRGRRGRLGRRGGRRHDRP